MEDRWFWLGDPCRYAGNGIIELMAQSKQNMPSDQVETTLVDLTLSDMAKLFVITCAFSLPAIAIVCITIWIFGQQNVQLTNRFGSFFFYGGHALTLFPIWVASILVTHRWVANSKPIAAIFEAVILFLVYSCCSVFAWFIMFFDAMSF